MEILYIVIVLLVMVLVSAVLDRFMSKLSLPLVQIAAGAVAALIAGAPLNIDVDSELFLVLFIAPLLFDESRNVSKRALIRNMSSVLSLAIGLVLVIVLCVGFALHWLEPSIPLAAAFALGAALGPTDAVAVAALSEGAEFSPRQKAVLQGEAILNDASGIVSFQFAIAAAITGTFSLASAGQSFLITFAGGIGIGLVIGIVIKQILAYAHLIEIDSTVFYVTFELVTPFVTYLAAEALGVSGILAVVAAGLLMTFLPQRPTVASARIDLMSSNAWDLVSFLLNGIIFVLLGMQLVQIAQPAVENATSNSRLLILMLLVTAVVIGVRFIYVFLMEVRHSHKREKIEQKIIDVTPEEIQKADAIEVKFDGEAVEVPLKSYEETEEITLRQRAKNALLITLAGPKGAISMSICLTIPFLTSGGEAFPHRSDLIFIAAGVILITLLLANFLLPILGKPDEDSTREDEELRHAEAMVLQLVVDKLSENVDTIADGIVLRKFETRLSEMNDDSSLFKRGKRMTKAELRRWKRRVNEIRAENAALTSGDKNGVLLHNMDMEEISTQVRHKEADALLMELNCISDLLQIGLITQHQAEMIRKKIYLLQINLVDEI